MVHCQCECFSGMPVVGHAEKTEGLCPRYDSSVRWTHVAGLLPCTLFLLEKASPSLRSQSVRAHLEANIHTGGLKE